MEIKFLKRNIIKRCLGIPATSRPGDPNCWSYSDGKLTVDLKRTPELEKSGGAIRLEGGNLPERILIVLGEDQTLRVFRNRCTHVGHRRLDPVPGTETIQCCSINKSTYDFEGTKVYGPAPDSIISYPSFLEGDKLISTIR